MFADFSIGDNNTFSNLFMDYKLFAESKQTINSDNWIDFRGMVKPMQFDYAYCITCHKSQGSEFDKVLVFNEYMISKFFQLLQTLFMGKSLNLFPIMGISFLTFP
jgi:hypothetical protein